MRIWSLHPKYLDAKGLVALWRETLLAKAVLQEQTKGYKSHPQLSRFKQAKQPVAALETYLEAVFQEASARKYKFDKTKFESIKGVPPLAVTDQQIDYEWQHLLAKLEKRSPIHFDLWRGLQQPEPHPLFFVVKGPVEVWEIRS